MLGELKGAHASQDQRPDRLSDWTNQELADLYRVKRLLDAAGVPNALDRGLTDEGDPWMVFVGGDGEVFIHLCRLHGVYVLDSPNLKSPLRGADFNALIEAFTQRSLPRSETEADPEGRIVRITRGGKVRLHPSALLAALIWTLFLASEEIVLRMPEAEEADGGLADLEALGFDGAAPATGMPMLMTDSPISLEKMAERDGSEIDPRHMAAQEAFLRDHGNAVHHNSYGMGLSTIAIAFGFMAEQSLTDAPEAEANGFLTESAAEASDEEDESRVLADNKAKTSEEGAEQAAVITEMTEAEARSLAKAEAAAAVEAKETLDAAEAVAESKAFVGNMPKTEKAEVQLWVDADYPADPPQSVSTEAPAPKAKATAMVTPKAEQPVTQVTEVAKAETSAPAEPAFMTLSSLRTIYQTTEMESYSFGDLVVKSSFDLSILEEGDSGLGMLDGLPFLDLGAFDQDVSDSSASIAPGKAMTHLAGNEREFDSDALAFMSYLLGKESPVEWIVAEEKVIILDTAALQPGQDSSIMTWISEDGSLTSILGLQSEFQDFGLIA